MLLNTSMEGDTITRNKLISTIKCYNNEKEGTIKALLKNFILPKSDMAIKDQSYDNSCMYTIPAKPPYAMNERMKSINEAKQAFLNSTVNTGPYLHQKVASYTEPTLHYAQIAITTESEDTRSTGGGDVKIPTDNFKARGSTLPADLGIRKKIDPQHRKVSFKIKNASSSYKKPPLATKTMMTITSTKVSELTKKFNDLVNESQDGTIKQSKLAKTIEDLQTASKYTASNSSSTSSTLSSSPNIKIVYRQRRGSKRRNARKRCSSMDSIDKLILSDSSSAKIRVIRSKSDGTKIPKSPKKRVKPSACAEILGGGDSVDGNSRQSKPTSSPEDKKLSKLTVKNVVKKFECEIIAQSSQTSTIKPIPNQDTSTIPRKEKPKVPEKKSSLVLTKNIVVKDGVPKIRTIKLTPDSAIVPENRKPTDDVSKRKEPIYDKHKFKTNYIHSEKLPLQLVEIIQEDVDENKKSSVDIDAARKCENQDLSFYEELSSAITPNDSFLWRRERKSSSQIYSDSEKSTTDSTYTLVSMKESTVSCETLKDESQKQELEEVQISEPQEFQKLSGRVSNSDFESNLVEARNEVLVGFTSKPAKAPIVEDDYEPLEPVDNIVIIPVKQPEKLSKLNCPLPEIPKESPPSNKSKGDKENIYQCLFEMRSHPEGDECSIHNYEMCDEKLEERTRGDGDSDDGYEYCKSSIKPYCVTSSSGIQIAKGYQPTEIQNFAISKSVSSASTASYEKIGSERIYEKIPARPPKSKDASPSNSFVSYITYNESENIYDTIKQADGTSLSHCYESIPNSPSVVKYRDNMRKQFSSANVQKRLSFDTVSNVSHSTMSSEQKTNSIYGQRSVLSYSGQEIAFQVPSSETSVSDRSDDWVDVSDEEKNDEQKIIIVRERSRGRKSPVSWSQKVRHQWQTTPKPTNDEKDCDSSDSGHLYESLEPAPAPAHLPAPIDDDFDSFDSDTDSEDHDRSSQSYNGPPVPTSTLPSPPSGGPYTLTKIASAAQRKMREIKRNLTKRYSVAMDGNPFAKTQTNGTYDVPKTKKLPIYENYEKPKMNHIYSNINFNDLPNKTENGKANGFKDELKIVTEKRLSYGEVPPPLPEKHPTEKPSTPTSEGGKKDGGTWSRKTYFSFKSRFRRASSMAVDINTEVPSALKITNSTFYLTDSVDGDSGFSNCSDPPGSTETLSPTAPTRRRDGTKLRGALSESSPCLALSRPAVPPPPPPVGTDVSAVNEELKRLLPTLSRKDKAPRTRTSWYAECGADTISHTSNTSWYAEAGLIPAGNISSSSGASSGSHPASPLPHSLFTHEPLYQFYTAAKIESACRETGDSDSDAYEVTTPLPLDPAPVPPPPGVSSPPLRPSAMALVAPRGPARTLWCEVPEVVNSTVLSSLAPAQKRLQEAKFELLTSEASYLNSLNVLVGHFISHPAFRDPHILPRDDFDALFSTILPVRKCSQLLMNELEKCWQENILLQGICDIVRRHADKHFQVYVKYCEQQACMVRTLQRLREKPGFANALKRLESHPSCQSLSLHSFLMLPMQRVTRLPLLLDALLRNLAPGGGELEAAGGELEAARRALATLNHFVSQCNEGARSTERVEEMLRVAASIEFPHVDNAPLLGPACSRRDKRPVRWLVRAGEMTQLLWKSDELKLTFGKKFHKLPLFLFLFNDLLVITKKKGEESYTAVDWCARPLLEVCDSDVAPHHARHAVLLTLLENREGRTLEMLMSCASETELSRWSEALAQGGAGGGAGEAVYAGWDCPQVAALFAYSASQPDELALTEGDVLNVTRKTSEGWYYGERTRDGEAGWFPGAYTHEIASPHVRARNLRQRYRLLALSGTYLGHKKRTN